METMNFREKKKKSLKGPIFAITSFLVLGSSVVTYAMLNEKEPVIVGNKGVLLTGDAPSSSEVLEQNALETISSSDIGSMYEIKKNYLSDSSNEKIKSEISLPYVYMDSVELQDFNLKLNKKFTQNFEAYKSNMSEVEHNFTYRVNYEEYSSVVNNKPILSIIITEKMVQDDTSENSLYKQYTYNIDLSEKSEISQSDIIIDVLGASYKDIVKNTVADYLEKNEIFSKDEYKYIYTGLENFYFKEDVMHFLFNPGDLVDKSYGTIDITLEREL